MSQLSKLARLHWHAERCYSKLGILLKLNRAVAMVIAAHGESVLPTDYGVKVKSSNDIIVQAFKHTRKPPSKLYSRKDAQNCWPYPI